MLNLETASETEFDHFLNSFDLILSDVDGVIWTVLERIPGTLETIKALKAIGKTVRYVSNNSTAKHSQYAGKLRAAGYADSDHDLVLPVEAIIDHLKSINFTRKAYVVATTAFKEHLTEAGIQVAPDPPSRTEETIKAVMSHLVDDADVGAVILDLDVNFNFLSLQKSIVYLKRPDTIFITGASDKSLPVHPRLTLMGMGYFHEAIAEVSGRVPLEMAKPHLRFNHFIAKKFDIQDPSRVLFIGDSISEDMGFATNSGYNKLLVLTGNAKESDVENWNWCDEYKPKYYVKSLKVIGDRLDQKLQACVDCEDRISFE